MHGRIHGCDGKCDPGQGSSQRPHHGYYTDDIGNLGKDRIDKDRQCLGSDDEEHGHCIHQPQTASEGDM